MMNEIERNIRSLDDEDLIRMVKVDFADYTDEAMAIAQDELKRRDIPEEQPETVVTEAEAPVFFQPSRADILRRLLDEDPKYLESYESLIGFVTSMNIRNGEYQGYKAVIRKMDFDNFILFTEETSANNVKLISDCIAAGKRELAELIDEIAGESGVVRGEDDV